MNLLDNIYATEKWRDLPRRRLQIWGGTPHPKGMIAEKIPEVSFPVLILISLVVTQLD